MRALARGVALGLALGLALGAGCGAAAAPAAHRDDRTVDIALAHAGATALEIEQQLVVPIEHAMRRVPGVRSIEARIDAGGAVVRVELANRVAVDARLGEVRDAIAALRSTLPAEAAPPLITRRAASPVLALAVAGELRVSS